MVFKRPNVFDITAELRDWHFELHHQLTGVIYHDKRGFYDDGTYIEINLIKSVTEYPEYWIAKTEAAVYKLPKEEKRR